MSGKLRSIPREYRDIAKRAIAAGWRIEVRGSGHLAWIPPQGRMVFCPSTPGDRRSYLNVIRKLRHAGLQI